jgi:hypothetical protein
MLSIQESTRNQPGPAAPVFCNRDFPLLRKALLHYMRTAPDDPDSIHMSALYHRLGRFR